MTDLRTRLADALRKHYFWWPNHSSIGSEAHCQCGKRPRDWSYWADHATDVLLSLPGIAIVDPHDEETIERVYRAVWDANSTKFDNAGNMIDIDPWERHRRIARAALLAAANTAEEKP